MRSRFVCVTGVLFVSMCAGAVLRGAEQALPLKGGRPAVATVNGEAVSLDELVAELDPPVDRGRLLQGVGTPVELELLDRLVNVRLVAQEAATMGLGDLPEVRKQVDVTSRSILREVLLGSLVKDIEPDRQEVDKLYKELVREWKTSSLLFQDEAAAQRARDEIASGGGFDQVAEKAVAAKSAKVEGDKEYHRQGDYLPEIAEAVTKLDVGQVSPVIRIQAGFVVLVVTDVRYPDSPEARAEAESKVLGGRHQEALKGHDEALRREYVVVDKDVLDGLDYEAKEPGIDALLKDTRAVADIKGGTPVTVADLTDYLRMQFFHGGDPAAQGKRMNARKAMALDATLSRRLLNMEAERLGIDKSNEYLDRVNAYEDSLVFNAFVQKVIAPDSKLREEQVKSYYDEHVKDYSSPEMMRIRSLAFTGRSAAEAAMAKLREGADFGWLVANAEGQADKGAQGVLTFDGRPVTTSSMPEGMQKALAGAKAGESRLYASPDDVFYVLAVQQVVPSNARPYDEVKEEIARKLHGERLKKNLDDYLGKLRAQSTIEVYLKRMQ